MQLQRVIHSHVTAEEDSVARYQSLREESGDPVAMLLLSELLADEEHHHAMFKRMEARLEEELGWSSARGSGQSAGPVHPTQRKAEAAAYKELADREGRSAKHLRDAAKLSATSYSGLLEALLEAIASDSEKHEQLLPPLVRFGSGLKQGGQSLMTAHPRLTMRFRFCVSAPVPLPPRFYGPPISSRWPVGASFS